MYLLDQDRADDVEKFLRSVQQPRLSISEFSLYSIGIVLFRRKLFDVFMRLVDDLVINGGVRLLRLSAGDLKELTRIAQQFSLDFDDAYQYAIAERYGLIIVSFDSDFDRTERGRKTPAELIGT